MIPDCFYRIDGLNLFTGGKAAGFYIMLSTSAAITLRQIPVSTDEYQRVMVDARERVTRANLMSKKMLSRCGFQLHDQSACPALFVTDPAFGGSIAAEPEDLRRLEALDPESALGPMIALTPHNVDSPAQAMVLLILFTAWAEWAYDKMSYLESKQIRMPGIPPRSLPY